MTDDGSRVRLAVIGVSHHTAPLEQRERLAYARHEVGDGLDALLRASGATEGVLLSTCNRTELYVVEGPSDAATSVFAAWSLRLGADASAVGYVHRGADAVAHLYRVAAGLDSMVLGEAQIHGQVRDAWELCRDRASTILHRLFQGALQSAGRVRHSTQLSRGAASVSSAAVQLAKQIFGSLSGRHAMVLGAGETAELALACLHAEGVRAAIVANRTFERAEVLATRYGARAMHYEEAWSALPDVDVLLCSTASPVPIVTTSHMRAAAAARGDRPLCVLDIAVPRDVEAGVGQLDNVFLYDLDDLQDVVRASLERRRDELPAAEAMVAEDAARFAEWLAGLAAVPVLTEFRGRLEALREREVTAALARLGPLTAAQRAVVEQMSRALMNKFMHEPTVRLRAAARDPGGAEIAGALRYLFALDRQTPTDAAGEPPAVPAGRTHDSGDR